MIEKGATITKFKNTQESALAILDASMDHWSSVWSISYNIERLKGQHVALKKTGHGAFLYADLISRIEAAWQRQVTLQSDLQASLDDGSLTSLFQKEQKQIKYLFEKYEQQLELLESPPEPAHLSDHSSDEETISSSSSHDSAPPSSDSHGETGIDDELVPSIRAAFTVHVDSATTDGPLDLNTTSSTAAPPSPQTSDVLSSDALIPSSHEAAEPAQDLMPMMPPSPSANPLQININAPQKNAARAEAVMESSTEPTQPPHALSAGTLNDAGRLSGRKPRGWMKDLLGRFKRMFQRKRSGREETVG
ncbi:hypothetical protein CVT24_013352 [Panaeolus cyanescens]|uniref:Uncharacterized protein n=1 Tax=Panaeolus cyanescens TaxID=181874 RepID=A0A409WD72_9AGAR|nr:hypothetical protein CVT24_013352 [Panaeolus cyanescens]